MKYFITPVSSLLCPVDVEPSWFPLSYLHCKLTICHYISLSQTPWRHLFSHNPPKWPNPQNISCSTYDWQRILVRTLAFSVFSVCLTEKKYWIGVFLSCVSFSVIFLCLCPPFWILFFTSSYYLINIFRFTVVLMFLSIKSIILQLHSFFIK